MLLTSKLSSFTSFVELMAYVLYSLLHIQYRGEARIFQRGGRGSHCVKQKVLTRLSCQHPWHVLLKRRLTKGVMGI